MVMSPMVKSAAAGPMQRPAPCTPHGRPNLMVKRTGRRPMARRTRGESGAGHDTLLGMVNAPSYAARSMVNPDVGVFLAKVRALHGLTIEQAARLAGISTGMVSMLEHGKRRPSIVVAERLADAYKIPEDCRAGLMAEALPGVGKDGPFKRRS